MFCNRKLGLIRWVSGCGYLILEIRCAHVVLDGSPFDRNPRAAWKA